MKYPSTRLVLVAIAALATDGISTAFAQSRKPINIQPPAVANGSNSSRAPFPAARQFDDIRPADGQAIDKGVPPNSGATDPHPDPLPMPRVAILQPAGRGVTDPGLLPTGRPTVAISSGLDGTNVAANVRSTAHGSRDSVVADIDNRWMASHAALRAMRGTTGEMGAGGRTQFESVDEEVKDLDRDLRLALREARYATAEQWDASRARLASAYEAYSAAVARVDASAGLVPAQR